MSLVLVAHGTRDPAGTRVVREIAAGVRARLPGVGVRVAFVDVRRPAVAEVLDGVAGPAVVVPAFLASGYHVRVDVPEQVARSGHPAAVMAEPIGPVAPVVAAAQQRLAEAGWRRGDSVVLAAAGSSDEHALADVRRAAIRLSARTGGRVRIGYLTTARPSLDEAVRACGGDRVAVASWLLAPGLFHRWVRACSADVVAEPIGAHAAIIDQVVRRYFTALPRLAGPAPTAGTR
jgi:sirohydrochlorin ferrochelatase